MLLDIRLVGRLRTVKCAKCDWTAATPHPGLLGWAIDVHLRGGQCQITSKRSRQFMRLLSRLKATIPSRLAGWLKFWPRLEAVCPGGGSRNSDSWSVLIPSRGRAAVRAALNAQARSQVRAE